MLLVIRKEVQCIRGSKGEGLEPLEGEGDLLAAEEVALEEQRSWIGIVMEYKSRCKERPAIEGSPLERVQEWTESQHRATCKLRAETRNRILLPFIDGLHMEYELSP